MAIELTPGLISRLPHRERWFYNSRVRSILFQVLAIAAVVGFIYYFLSNAFHNMETRGISTGFHFLDNKAGFGIIQSLIPYDETYTYGRTFLVGLLNTLLVSVLGIVLATALGFVLGVARLSRNWLVSRVAAVYVELFRNIPLLLQIFFWYFAVLRTLPTPRQSISLGEAVFLNIRGLYIPAPVPEVGFGWLGVSLALAIGLAIAVSVWARRRQRLTGQTFPSFWVGLAIIVVLPLLHFYALGAPLQWDLPTLKGFNFKGGITIIPELAALLVALSIYTAAFIAEIVRSGILAVSKGQHEAAESLGLSHGQTLRLVIVPQALRVIIPPLTSQFLNLTKNSSLATAIGYPDLVSVFMGTTLNQTGQAVEVIAMTMAVYLLISLVISYLMNVYNAKKALVER
ncbi:amino acid ABC transporter permease [Pseudaeromonas paramecii]